MSIKIMTLVWDKFEGSGSELLAMLAMTDWCNDAGGSLHPSIDTLAKKIRVSESQARRVLRKLMDEGFIAVIGNAGGGAPGMTRHYRVNVEKLRAMPDITSTGGVDATPGADATPQAETGGMDARDGSHGCGETGGMGDTQTTSITTIEPPTKGKRTKKPVAPVVIPSAPDWMPAKPWADYIDMRHEKKKVPTARAVELVIIALEQLRTAGHDIGAVLNQSTRNSWTDVYPVKQQNGSLFGAQPSERMRTSYDRTSDEKLARRLNAAVGVVVPDEFAPGDNVDF